MDQPANSSYAVTLHPREQRFGYHSSDAGSLLVGSHQIAVFGERPKTIVLDAFVSGHRDDLAIVICDDDLTIERKVFEIITPCDEA